MLRFLAVVAFCLAIACFSVSSAQHEASCDLLLRGHGAHQPGLVTAELNCSTTTPILVAINTTHIGQYARKFTGVKVVSSLECQWHTEATSMASSMTQLPPADALLQFCYNGSLVLRPTVENLFLSQPENADAWTTAVFSFSGNIRAAITGGSFQNNSAGSQLLLLQQANVTVVDTGFIRNTAHHGAAAFVTDQASIAFNNATFMHLYSEDRGAVIASTRNATISLHNSLFHNISALAGGCIRAADSSIMSISNSTFDRCNARVGAGGAVAAVDFVKLDISNSTFTHGNASLGAAVSAFNHSQTGLTNCSFVDNTAPGDASGGGALAVLENAQMHITSSYFANNSAAYGGAVALLGESQAVVDGTAFHSNTASASGGALEIEQSAKLEVGHSLVAGNTAVQGGGALYAVDSATALFMNSLFDNNTAVSGGCFVLSENSTVTIRLCNMTRNTATGGGNGGVMYAEGQTQASMVNCNLLNNTADTAGGCMHLIEAATLQASRTTFTGNMAVAGGAINLNTDARCDVHDSSFQQNSAAYGAVMTGYNRATMNATNSSFSYNVAGREGGVLSVTDSVQVVVTDSIFSNNFAGLVGGVLSASQLADTAFIRCNLTANQAASYGGAVSLVMDSRVSIQQSVVDHCNATQGGAGLCQHTSSIVIDSTDVFLNNASAGGGFVAIDSCRVVIHNTILHQNSAKIGGGVVIRGNASWNISGSSAIERNNASELGGGAYLASPQFNPIAMQIFVHNNAGAYSDDVYVEPMHMHIVGNSSFTDFVSRLGADVDSLLPVHLSVIGYQSWPVEGILVQCDLIHESFKDPLFLGVNRSTSSGDVLMSLRVRQPPGRYALKCAIPGEDVPPAVHLTLDIRHCIRGEITPSIDSCQVCQVGYFSFSPGDKECSICPAGLATCPGGSLLIPEPGAWRSTANSTQLHRCPNAGACTPVSTNVLVACEASPQCREAANFSDLQCSAGYEGNLCGVCTPGYGVVKPYTCRGCMPRSTITALYIVAALVMLAFMKALVSFTMSANREMLPSGLQQPRLSPSDLLRPLLLYSQYILIIGSMSIDYPDTIAVPLRVLAWFWSPASPETLSVDCLLSRSTSMPASIQRVLFYLCMPLVMLVLLLCIEAATLRLWHKSSVRAGIADRLYSSVLVAAFFFLPSVARTIFSMFACVSIDEPAIAPSYTAGAVGTYWALDLNAQCWTGYHRAWSLGLGVPLLLLVCIGMPAGIFYKVLVNRHRLNDPNFALHYGFLYRAYTPACCYWEACVVVQTQLLVAVGVFGTSLGPFYQGLLMTGVLAAAGFLLLAMQPFAHVGAYRVAVSAICCLLLTSYTTLSFIHCGPVEAGAMYGLIVGCFVLLVNVLFIVSVLWELYKVINWRQLRMILHSSWHRLAENICVVFASLGVCGGCLATCRGKDTAGKDAPVMQLTHL